MPEKGKVSIIVPIYKVRKYIHRCITSIVHQTYANLEIILVDDGCPDNCGEIADGYQKEDARIKVIHKENGGLSDARNHGMKAVTGEYTMFVDSDDWLEKDMVQTMVTCMRKHEADVIQSAFYYAYDDKLLVDRRYFGENDQPVILKKEQIMEELVTNEKMKNFAWGKLYKTELIRNIPFKKGVLFEDIFWAHHVMHRAAACIILPQPFYNYYQRDDSIVAAYSIRNLDMITGLKERHDFIQQGYPHLMAASYRLILKMSLIHYHLLVMNRGLDKDKLHREEIETYVRANRKKLKAAVNGDRELSIQLFLFSIHPYVNMGCLGVRKGLRHMKLLQKPAGLDRADKRMTKEVLVK